MGQSSAAGPRAVLIGPPGSGKTTVGQALAELWGVAFRDTDADVEAAQGRDIPSIFLEEGEQGFRALERAAVEAALAEHDGVLALGGGAVLNVETQADLDRYRDGGGLVAFLDVSLSAVMPRVGLNRSRPLLGVNPRQQWSQLMEARRPVYERLASIAVTTDQSTPEQVAQAIAMSEARA